MGMSDMSKLRSKSKTFKEIGKKFYAYMANNLHTDFKHATVQELYRGIAYVVHDELHKKRNEFNRIHRKKEKSSDGYKQINYICMEFLIGQSLKNNLYNLNATEVVDRLLKRRGLTVQDLYDVEPDAGLGNGGLGRLASCYMDALATCGYDATGYSLCYEYGLFKQKIVDGWQVEMPDNWLPGGRVWLEPREDNTFKVRFYGDYKEWWDSEGFKYSLENAEEIDAIPYDMFISGSDSDAVCKLRLWRADASATFDMASFNSGDFSKAAQIHNRAEIITKVLYPADNIEEGKELRIKQQYLMSSASCQNIVRDHFKLYNTLSNFSEKTVIHINDTHPALCVPELMRIFLDDYGCTWDFAWNQVVDTVSYTNHTVLAEALEKWDTALIERMIPRVYSIIKEINRRFRIKMASRFPGDVGKINYMSPLGNHKVNMANLAIIGSHKVNGVSSLHSEILKDDLFHDFYLAYPDRFTNVTNGIAYRRWLCQSNPALAALIDNCIGSDYRLNASKLEEFAAYGWEESIHRELELIKIRNKRRFSDMVHKNTGIKAPDPESVFIVQAKRIHEYKRQLMNALRIIYRYIMLLDNPSFDMRPETYFFAGKAAPSYYMAKEIIQLICKIGAEIDKNPKISSKLRVIFLENYDVSMAEALMPAAEISEQISLAGKEASGTGNMKMMINGAITIGTLDGANIEMRNAVGDDNIFIFGQKADEVNERLRNGYRSKEVVDSDPRLQSIMDMLERGFAGKSFSKIKDYLLNASYSIPDPYMCLYDFDDYCRAHEEIMTAYENRKLWNAMSITNIAEASKFSADNSIKKYASSIWHTKPILQRT